MVGTDPPFYIRLDLVGKLIAPRAGRIGSVGSGQETQGIQLVGIFKYAGNLLWCDGQSPKWTHCANFACCALSKSCRNVPTKMRGWIGANFPASAREALLGPYHKVIKVIEGSPRNILSLLNHRAFDTKPVKRQTESEEAIRMRRKNHA